MNRLFMCWDCYKCILKWYSVCLVSKASSHFVDCLGVGKGGVICISEVIDISLGNLDSSLCFFQPSVSHDVHFI